MDESNLVKKTIITQLIQVKIPQNPTFKFQKITD